MQLLTFYPHFSFLFCICPELLHKLGPSHISTTFTCFTLNCRTCYTCSVFSVFIATKQSRQQMYTSYNYPSELILLTANLCFLLFFFFQSHWLFLLWMFMHLLQMWQSILLKFIISHIFMQCFGKGSAWMDFQLWICFYCECKEHFTFQHCVIICLSLLWWF